MINTDFQYSVSQLYAETNKTKTIKELNGFYISHFLKLMYNTVDVLKVNDGSFGAGESEKIFRDFLLNEYGKAMSDRFQLTNSTFDRYCKDENLNRILDVNA